MPQLDDPVAVSLGIIDIRWYAVFILGGIAAALALSCWLARARGLDPGFLLDIAPWVIVISIVGARTYYVMLEWNYFQDNFAGAFNIRAGGLSIHGALVVGVAAVVVICRVANQSALTWLDLIAPGAALGQAIGRWGNWANQEAFGTPSDLPWALTIESSRRPAGFEQFTTFHPTFLYESFFNLANAAMLSWLVLKLPRLPRLRTGDVSAVYLISYGVARFLIERIRLDSLMIGPLPAAYWLSYAMIVCGLLLLVLNRTVLAATGEAVKGASS